MESDFLYIRIDFFKDFFFYRFFFFLGPSGPEKSRLGCENLSLDQFSWKSEANLMISYHFFFPNFFQRNSMKGNSMKGKEILKFASDFSWEFLPWDRFSPQNLDFSGPAKRAPQKKKYMKKKSLKNLILIYTKSVSI